MTQRLAAYLGGELDADETSRLEAELARDPALRTQLAAMQRADEALASVRPAEPPAGYDERLRAAMDRELEQLLPPAEATVTELASRRRSWLPALAGAAAVVVLLAVVGTVMRPLGSGEDAATDDAGVMQTMDAPEEESGLEAADEDAAGAEAPFSPTVADYGRSLAEDEVAVLLDETLSYSGAVLGLRADAGQPVAVGFSHALGATEVPAAAEDGDEPAEGESRTTDPLTTGALEPQYVGDANPDDLEQVGRCLDTLLEAEGELIPVVAELLTFDGEPAIAFGLVSLGADRENYDRIEVWIVDRAGCEVRHFSQN